MTRSEFLVMSMLDKKSLHGMVNGMSFPKAMALRRELQVGLADYSKNRGGRQDKVQDGAQFVIGQIESWCRHGFFRQRMVQLLKSEPGLALKPKATVKGMVRKEWEDLCKRLSY